MGIINKLFTEDQINIIKDMNNLRELQETLNKWGLKYRTIIGSKKPNRYRFAYSGYMIKVALDDSGKRDNLKEYEISGSLYPLVVKCYECSADGSIAVFELVDGVWICTPFFFAFTIMMIHYLYSRSKFIEEKWHLINHERTGGKPWNDLKN